MAVSIASSPFAADQMSSATGASRDSVVIESSHVRPWRLRAQALSLGRSAARAPHGPRPRRRRLDECVDGGRRDALAGRLDVDQRVAVDWSATLGIGHAGPGLGDELAVEVGGHLDPDLLVVVAPRLPDV